MTQWKTAAPKTDNFSWARRIFSTDNSRGVCAGFSQTWLMLSLLQGTPLMNAGLLSNPKKISNIHKDDARGRAGKQSPNMLGGASAVTLPHSGLKIKPPYPVFAKSTNWKEIFDHLANQGAGYYYLTIKQPFTHAMACFMNPSDVYYLEPTNGLYQFSKAKFAEGVTSFYGRYQYSPNNDFKFYQVELM